MVNISNLKGFSLIELMITVTVMGLLLFMGASLSTGWTDSAHQQQAKSLVEEGISRARSVALRNPDAVQEGAPAIGLCLNNQILSIVRQSSSNLDCTSTSSTLLWSTILPNDIIIKEASNSNRFLCLGMDSRGLLLPDDLGNQQCSLSTQLKSTSLHICPCAASKHSQHSSLCPLNDQCLEARLY